jgi:hypothetical protein
MLSLRIPLKGLPSDIVFASTQMIICLVKVRPSYVTVNNVLVTSAVDLRFDPRSVQTEDYSFDLCCFSDENAVLESKNKYCWFGVRI